MININFIKKIEFYRSIKLIKLLFAPFALIFILISIWESRVTIQYIIDHSLPFYLFISVLMWAPVHILSPFFAYIVLGESNVKISYKQYLILHLSTLPARYIPGGIWHTAARVNKLHQLGVHPRFLGGFVILENVVAVGTALIIGGILVSCFQIGSKWQLVAYLSAIISIIILIICPVLLNKIILNNEIKIQCKQYVFSIIIGIVFWLFPVVSFNLYFYSLNNTATISRWIEISGAYLFSWGIGFIAIFAPQGIGIFEAVLSDIMPLSVSFNVLIVVIFSFRFVAILADIFIFLLFLLIKRILFLIN